MDELVSHRGSVVNALKLGRRQQISQLSAGGNEACPQILQLRESRTPDDEIGLLAGETARHYRESQRTTQSLLDSEHGRHERFRVMAIVYERLRATESLIEAQLYWIHWFPGVGITSN